MSQLPPEPPEPPRSPSPPPSQPPPPSPAGPPAPASPAAAEVQDPIVLTIGDIGVTRNWVVTPNGNARLAGSQWIARDMTRVESRIPPWAIVLAIVFALACLLGLLFLLVKEQYTTGYVEVSVQAGTLFHATQIPVSGHHQVAHVRQQVSEAQTLAAAAS
jgi:hypothetical protein